MTLFHDWQVSAAPVWLQRANGIAWHQAHGVVKDIFVDAARAATKAGWPLATPADGLSFIARERSLARVPSDTDATHALRLCSAFDLWEYGGTSYGVETALNTRYPLAGAVVLTYWTNPTFFGVNNALWARYYITMSITTWGAPAVWGAAGLVWGAVGLTWGISAPLGEVAELRALLRTWAAGYAKCTGIRITTSVGDIEITT